MLNIAVIDDEDMYIDRICKITEKCMDRMSMDYEIHVYKSGKDILGDLKRGRYFDLYLLDMKLPDVDGLEVAKQIRRVFSEPILIYISHFRECAIDGYEVNAYRYIVKTELEEKLPQAYLTMGEALRKRKKYERFYMAEHYGKRSKIFYRDIYYLKKDKKYVIIVHKDGEMPVRMSLTELVEKLRGEEFLVIERGFAVNLDHVISLKDNMVRIGNGENLPVSRSKWNHVRDAIMNNGG